MMNPKRERFERLKRFLWATGLFLLPITSFRYLPLGSGTQVKPLSLVPFAFLLALLLLESLLRRKWLFKNSAILPLLAFILIAMVASGVGFLLAPPNLYEYTYPNRMLRAWATFAIGLVFFFVPLAMNRDEEEMNFMLQWLYRGFIMQVVWSGVQLAYFLFEPYYEELFPHAPLEYLNTLDMIQKTVMMAGLAPNHRISGLALEPSWLAAQLGSTYLPWLFATWLSNYFWRRRRWHAIMLGLCLLTALLSFSRGGLLVIAAAMVLTFLLTGQAWSRKVWTWWRTPFSQSDIPHRASLLILRLGIALALFLSALGAIWGATSHPYFAKLWRSEKSNLVDYFVDIYAGPRLALAWAGWRIFEQHPWAGVGLGAAGFYLIPALPDWSHFNIPETAQLLASSNTLFPNIKNLYIRLLAETGIFGFWAFVAFYAFLLGKSLWLARQRPRWLQFTGISGVLGCLTIIGLGLSFDSLANPMIWVTPGLVMGLAENAAGETPETQSGSAAETN
ncbi:MAG: O-antigen ligase family protein [Anaerolineales bacterium]|nr:O-antigen ligase family protein [Anaerolineales bacterium]